MTKTSLSGVDSGHGEAVLAPNFWPVAS